MRRQSEKRVLQVLSWIALSAMLLSGCGSSGSTAKPDAQSDTPPAKSVEDVGQDTSETSVEELTVRFGDEGEPFTLYMEENQTTKDIARHVGTASWRLPIYRFDDYDGWEVMQYYDIPSRYEITSAPEAVTSEKAGEVYYSEPNRIILFYHDAEISGDYTYVGTFDATDEFVEAVENNPVLEGWGNKIVNISID